MSTSDRCVFNRSIFSFTNRSYWGKQFFIQNTCAIAAWFGSISPKLAVVTESGPICHCACGPEKTYMRYHHFCVPLFPKSDFCAVWILQLPPSIGEAMVETPVFHSVNSSQHSYSGHLIILSNNVLLISTLESRQCFRLLSNSNSNYFRVPALLEGELALSAVSKTDGRITQSDADEFLFFLLILNGRGDRFGKNIVG